jgi:hypothetical protein
LKIRGPAIIFIWTTNRHAARADAWRCSDS